MATSVVFHEIVGIGNFMLCDMYRIFNKVGSYKDRKLFFKKNSSVRKKIKKLTFLVYLTTFCSNFKKQIDAK